MTFSKELLVEVLTRLLAHEHAAAPRVFAGPAGAAHHLENVHDGVVDVSMLFALVRLNAHDDRHVARDRQAPRSVLDNVKVSNAPYHEA